MNGRASWPVPVEIGFIGVRKMQVEAAVKESDAVLLVLDARAGVGPEEEHLARWLLRMVRA